MSYRKSKQTTHQIKDVKPSQYLNDGLVHTLKNTHHQIKVINWNGTVKQIKQLLGDNNELIINGLLVDKSGKNHFTHDYESTEPNDNYIYQQVSFNGYRIVFDKNTLFIHQIDYQKPFYESKIYPINESHLKNKYPDLIN